MILFKVSKLEDDYLLHQYLRAMVYFYHKHIMVGLVILNGEKNSYEQFVQDRIYELLSKENASFLVNQKGGIHLIKETMLSEEEQYLLYAFSDMIVEERKK